MRAKLQRAWYRPATAWWLWLLWPLRWLYGVIFWCHQRFYQAQSQPCAVPVIVVGNITLGGSGKSPCVIALVQYLQNTGWRPGVITRGYKGGAQAFPLLVTPQMEVAAVGDEAMMICQQVSAPVVVDPHRRRGVNYLADYCDCDVIVSDDGLQHAAMARDIEIAVVDGVYRYGNGRRFPMGPLRDSMARLKTVDYKLCNGGVPASDEVLMQLRAEQLYSVVGDHPVSLSLSDGAEIYAVAGIGHPDRFFSTLRALSLSAKTIAFPDHYSFSKSDFHFLKQHDVVIMTAKDAVKCRAFADHRYLYLPVTALLPSCFLAAITQALGQVRK